MVTCDLILTNIYVYVLMYMNVGVEVYTEYLFQSLSALYFEARSPIEPKSGCQSSLRDCPLFRH